MICKIKPVRGHRLVDIEYLLPEIAVISRYFSDRGFE